MWAGRMFQRLGGEGTNSARLFTPAERKALAKCEVHQTSRASGYDPRVDLPLISKKWRTVMEMANTDLQEMFVILLSS